MAFKCRSPLKGNKNSTCCSCSAFDIVIKNNFIKIQCVVAHKEAHLIRIMKMLHNHTLMSTTGTVEPFFTIWNYFVHRLMNSWSSSWRIHRSSKKQKLPVSVTGDNHKYMINDRVLFKVHISTEFWQLYLLYIHLHHAKSFLILKLNTCSRSVEKW